MSTARIDIDEPIQGARPMVGGRVAMTGRVVATKGQGTDEVVEIEVEQMAFQPQPMNNMVGEVRGMQAAKRGPAFGGGGSMIPPGGPPV
jgi:hypothetical protein